MHQYFQNIGIARIGRKVQVNDACLISIVKARYRDYFSKALYETIAQAPIFLIEFPVLR